MRGLTGSSCLHRGPALGGTGITGAGVCADPAVGRLRLGAHDKGGTGDEDRGELHFLASGVCGSVCLS